MTGQLVALSPRDRLVLKATAELRLVNAAQLTRIAFNNPDNGGSTHPRIARRCLQRLIDQGLLLRVQRRVGGLQAGSGSSVLALSDRGHRAIGRPGRARHRQPSLAFASHQLAVAETFVVLHEALYARRLAALEISAEPSSWRAIEDSSGSQLKPDLFVVASTDSQDRLAFIEVDLGSEHRAAIARKARLYQAHWQSGREQAEQGVYPVVLWQAAEPARRSELARWLAQAPSSALHRVIAPDQLITELLKGGTQ